MLYDPQFWVFVAFIIFIGVTLNPVRKKITSRLDSKINEIKENIERAEKIKYDAQRILSEIKKRDSRIIQEIEIIQKQAKEKIIQIEQNAIQNINEQIKKRNDLINARIDQMTRDANMEINDYVVRRAINSINILLENKLGKTEKQNLINQSINELHSILKY